jgi:hypothetical protein
LVGAGIGGVLVLWLIHSVIPWWTQQLGYGPRSSATPVFVVEQFNCQFAEPGPHWKRDDKAKVFGRASLVGMRRTDPNGWLVLAAQDHKTRTPRAAEVTDDVLRRLADVFKNLEWNQMDDDCLAEQRAQHLIFQGDVNHVRMAGDCYVLVFKGISYWFTVWGPAESAEESREGFRELRKGFALLKERDGWTEKRPAVVTFLGEKVPYSLRDTEGIWEKWNQSADADPAADLLLQAKDQIETKHDSLARVLVLVLDKQPDLPSAVKSARAHLESQQRQIYPNTNVEVVLSTAGAEDHPANVGEVPGHMVKLHVKNTEGRERLVLLAVVNQPNKLLVIQCECDWKRRSREADFTQLLGTFRLKVP